MRFRVGGKVFEGRTRNVSRGGLCAELADTVPLGTVVDIDMTLVFDDDMRSEALRLPARVVWCTDLDEAHQVGVVFLPLDAERSQYVTMFLRYLDDARAVKAPRASTVDERFG